MDNSGYTTESGVNNGVTHSVDIEMDTRAKSHSVHSGKVGVAEMIDKKDTPLATEPYSGMGKDDLLRFSQTPFWNRLRFICLTVFWVGWLALILAVVILTILSPRCNAAPSVNWLQTSVPYQVYVRSFYDSDNDGVGDLNGVTHKLDYLKNELHVDTLLLSSVFVSHDEPDVQDFGYDIVDHMNIHPDYGTMADFETLVNATHEKEMKLIVDFVPNHTGWNHPWFVASNNSADPATNPYWNYYVWADCSVPEPTNWRSIYGGSAWELGRGGSECYLHQLLNHQPELNLRSSAVRAELERILRFWLNHGVDGFRVTSAKYLYEDADYRNDGVIAGCTDPVDYNCLTHNSTSSQPENIDIIASWRNILEEFTMSTGRIRVLLTDANEDPATTVAYYGRTGDIGAHLPLNYQLSDVTAACLADWCVNTLVGDWMAVVPSFATSSWIVGSQDLSRLASNVGDTYARALLMLQMTLPGVPITYYGDELGMVNGNLTGPSVDPAGQIDLAFSRDNYRLPMQWSAAVNGGFTNSTNPWLPINYDYETRNAQDQLESDDTHTPVKLFAKLASLRKSESALHYGNIHNMSTGYSDVIGYVREFDGTNRLLVVLNFGTVTRRVSPTYFLGSFYVEKEADVVITTHANMGEGEPGTMYGVDIDPGKGIIYSWPYSR